jgi:hypothetical protein
VDHLPYPTVSTQSHFWVSFCTIHHTLAAVMMMPVAVMGWDESGHTSRALFVFGTWWGLSHDVFDFVYASIRCFLPNMVFKGSYPLLSWILLPVMHHVTTMITVSRMCVCVCVCVGGGGCAPWFASAVN